MPAAWAGVAVAAGSAIAGAVQAGSATSGGAAKASGISREAVRQAGENYANDRAPYQNYLYGGQNALAELNGLSGTYGPEAAAGALSNFQSSPGYQFQLDQGLRAVDAGAAAKGILRSGATLAAEQTLGSNLANQGFQQYVNNLNTLAGYGLQAAGGQANTTATYNNLASGQATNQAGIATSAAGTQASIYGNAAQQLGNTATNALSNYQYNQRIGNGNYSSSGTDSGLASAQKTYNPLGTI